MAILMLVNMLLVIVMIGSPCASCWSSTSVVHSDDFFLFYFILFYFTILYWFCHTSTWIRHGCTRVPNPEPPSHLPPHAISLGHPSAPASTWKQPRCPSADEWIRKLWYIYTMEHYSAIKKNTFESVLMRWMKLEPIIQSEVSQKAKHQYSILTHIYGI